MNYEQLLLSVIDAIRLHSDITFSWYGRRNSPPTELLSALSAAERRRYLVASLQERLYESFYCQGRPVPIVAQSLSSMDRLGDPSLISRLSAANQGKGHLDPGWIVYSIDAHSLQVIKDGLEVSAPRNMCSRGHSADEGDEGDEGDEVLLSFPKELRSISPGFYMALADAPDYAADSEGRLRLYWNVTPAGAVTLVEGVTRRLNDRMQAFRLKALNHPAAYRRNDAAVLYIPAASYRILKPILEEIYASVANQVRDNIPALTKALAPGLGAAEDPSGDTSFGLHRCNLIADGLVWAWEQSRIHAADRLAAVRRRFSEDGISITQPYLNSGSRDLYEPLEERVAGGQRFMSFTRAISFPKAARDFTGAAHAIGTKLAKSAVWHNDKCTWFGYFPRGTDTDSLSNRSVYMSLGPDLYSGTAGISWFLAELFATTGDAEMRALAEGAMRHALFRAEASRASLFSGAFGISLAGAHIAGLIDSEEVDILSCALARAACSDLAGSEFDIIDGQAGMIVGLLSLWDIWHHDWLVEAAVRLGDSLVLGARSRRGGYAWRPAKTQGNESLTGMSHGAAGAAWALAELYSLIPDERYSYAVHKAFGFERSWFDADAGNWFDLRHIAGGEHPAVGRLPHGVSWCHGAPGIALSRIRGHQVIGRQEYRDEAEIALSTTARAVQEGIRLGLTDYSVCHGLAGNALVLALGAASAGVSSSDNLDMVMRMAAVAGYDAYGDGRQPWPCGAGPGENPSLMLGLAGIGYFLLCVDRALPKRIPLAPRTVFTGGPAL